MKLQESIVNYRAAILAAIWHRRCQRAHQIGIHENQIHYRVAFGFRSPDALAAVALLSLSGHKPVVFPDETNPLCPKESGLTPLSKV